MRILRGGCVWSVCLLVVIFGVGIVHAHDEKDPRHKAMTGLAQHMKALSGKVKSGGTIADDDVARAKQIEATSQKMLDLFPAGSTAHNSRAKPEIWTDWKGFSASAQAFEAAAGNLLEATRSGQLALVGTALQKAGAACGGCHKAYRLPKK